VKAPGLNPATPRVDGAAGGTRYQYEFPTRRTSVKASPEAVFKDLRDVASYPKWWPEVKGAQTTADPRVFNVLIKSALPYELRLKMTRVVDQPPTDNAPGKLRVLLDGDLKGFAEWTLTRNADGGTDVRYDQSANVEAPTLKLAERLPFARSLMIWNHTRMMDDGFKGLQNLDAFGPAPH
jgi:uncharacterized protein YndB with AHSA1/START domain